MNTGGAAAGPWSERLQATGYLPDPELAAAVELALVLARPLLLEGPAGSGKTSLAQALAAALGRPLVRLQCFEGLDASHVLYDWNYHRQLADLARNSEADVFGARYLLPRPLLQALQAEAGAVLLVDEVDRADSAFEALLLEFLAEYQITIPEWKTVRALVPPVVVLTSNRTRPLSDALRRRCLYAWVGWPGAEREQAILARHVPQLPPALAARVVRAVQCMRQWPLVKPPGLAETLDWGRAWAHWPEAAWTESWLRKTLSCVVKDAADLALVSERLPALLDDT
ncbi:MAG: MoxR family ATPase [Alicyclobacillus sp.]|nr:MoxR family ATPase [Alicyclobacillus sp.]